MLHRRNRLELACVGVRTNERGAETRRSNGDGAEDQPPDPILIHEPPKTFREADHGLELLRRQLHASALQRRLEVVGTRPEVDERPVGVHELRHDQRRSAKPREHRKQCRDETPVNRQDHLSLEHAIKELDQTGGRDGP